MLVEEPRLVLPERPADQVGAEVAVWREPVVMATYRPVVPDPYPAFLDGRVYQGSSGRVYPLPFHDRISAEPEPVAWDAVHLENRWLRLMVLPGLGGRIHVAQDRTNGYDFVYRNDVIKPALVGLAGPWLAGGIELNWPQHHRPATFLPTDVEITHDDDGSVTVWCSDHDPFTRMKGMHGVRLAPDRAVVELRVRLYNRHEEPQSFLWWANVAARAHDDYQAFFPTDVHVVADHARRAITAFPAADRPYYDIDYPSRRAEGFVAADGTAVAGDRLDWYRNIPVPTSYMALGSREDFFGGYDHRADAGFVHVADHRIAVGKKLWTWGNAEFGRAWCRNLADDGAQYVELMAGVYSDNQPDFATIMPGETTSFSQYWYPLRGSGPVHAATTEAALHADVREASDGTTTAELAVVVTRERGAARVELSVDGVAWRAWAVGLAPGAAWRESVEVPAGSTSVDVRVVDGDEELVRRTWTRPDPAVAATGVADVAGASPAREPADPAEIGTVEELALVAAHLTQYRHATRRPEPYWREALRRDPGHIASLAGLAVQHYRAGEYPRSEELLRAALGRATTYEPHPVDGAPHYYLGLVLERTGRSDEADAAFAQAAWTRAWRGAAGYRLARLDAAAGRDAQALARVDEALRAEPEHLQAHALRAIVLRRLGRAADAEAQLAATLALDPLHAWARDLAGRPLATDAQTWLDVGLEHARAGEHRAAVRAYGAAWDADAARDTGAPAARPLAAAHEALARAALGDAAGADRARARAVTTDRAWCFPGRLDDHDALARLAAERPEAAALLGTWLYSHDRARDAVVAWSTAVAVDAQDAVTWRNLGIAAYREDNDLDAARRAYDRALAAAPHDTRLAVESDALDRRRAVSPADRLAALLASGAARERDEAAVAVAHLRVTLDDPAAALEELRARSFHPWEGGEGQVLAAWERASLASAAQLDDAAALEVLDGALLPPQSLGEARHPLATTARLDLARGDVLARLGRTEDAAAAWRSAAAATADFLQMSAQRFGAATYVSVLALHRLGRADDAQVLTDDLAAYGEELERAPLAVDYFATSLPDLLLFAPDPETARRVRVELLRAQVDSLRGASDRARERLRALLAVEPDHADAVDLERALARGGRLDARADTTDREPPRAAEENRR
ncbi:TPR repeat-containing protein [Beutenbergia cavernae DSM 12333]|uniref:TPR repeat-containing protein n=1 Tax=Beutenbergia cavernae (strain ATCC BAA-8 / DSM 12333 / CCUG 43141 / JCM 11478 / NBRC 16432 / NCIMB 13614 / HKI 0122) TaxID=471853 RepID=C5BZM7_BEUC1|nr:DUF5107 domain-containing protein [Beutenbergia cavernae]ACQ79199.1 TPR repeat-containing protein [Beutenbergia cavernae DSM 12333]